jgi:hypothetical protein
MSWLCGSGAVTSGQSLTQKLQGRETEVMSVLAGLYAEVRQWELELGEVRRAKRSLAIAIEADRPGREAGPVRKHESAEADGSRSHGMAKTIAFTPSR